MMREYKEGDVFKVETNEFSIVPDLSALESPIIEKYTQESNGKITAIVAIHEYWKDCYETGFILGKELNLSEIKELETFAENAIITRKPTRVQTSSIDCPVINRWMEFMGFECEGIKRKFMFRKDYKMWSRINGD